MVFNLTNVASSSLWTVPGRDLLKAYRDAYGHFRVLPIVADRPASLLCNVLWFGRERQRLMICTWQSGFSSICGVVRNHIVPLGELKKSSDA
jgi:hypothetical protein